MGCGEFVFILCVTKIGELVLALIKDILDLLVGCEGLIVFVKVAILQYSTTAVNR